MKVSFFTLGCKVNMYETQSLAQGFREMGFQVVNGEKADVFVVNSCTVTHIADRKARGIVRRIRRNNPDGVIILTGCMPQFEPSMAEELCEADIILGNGEKSQAPLLAMEYLKNGKRIFEVGDIFRKKEFEPMHVKRFDDSFQRAYLKVEDGCDCFCSYCAIGFARGPVRSAPIELIENQADEFLKNGYKELVLTGINLSRYGTDIGLRPSDAIAAVCNRNGDFRVRLGSVEPNLMDLKDFEVMKDLPRLCPHFHLALQSGCDDTLKRMGRRYTLKEYMGFVDYIFKNFRNPSITTDIIVGFPGETDEEFNETCTFVSQLPLLKAHIFEYSPREGTRAAKFKNQTKPQLKKERFLKLEEICNERTHEFLKTQLNKEARILGEATGNGYTDNYISVGFKDKKPKSGQWQNVVLTEIDGEGIKAVF